MATHRTGSTTATRTTDAFSRIGYVVWAVAFAVGVLLHEWQKGEVPWSFHSVPAILAIVVLLRPASVERMVVLLATLAVELASDLPDPWNHTLMVGVIGLAITVWWGLQALRHGSAARDPGHVYEGIAPFLRVGFIVAFFAAAFAKLNTGFLDPRGTCAVWIMESIPLVSVPTDLRPPLIAGTVLLEFAIPLLLIRRRTRPAAIVLGFGFHLISALAGHTAFSGFAWSFYLLFLPPAVPARVAVAVRSWFTVESRDRIARAAATPLTMAALTAGWLLAVGLLQLLPDGLYPHMRRWGAALPYLAYSAVWALLLWRLRAHWMRWHPPAAGAVGSLRVRHAVFVAALAVFTVDAASPYIGLKTRYSFTMYSDLRTEPGLWNHLVVPEAVRIFNLQDGTVRFAEISDPELAEEVAGREGEGFVLLDARGLVAGYPAATVRYELDGVSRVAAPVATDPVLGIPVHPLVSLLGGFRPIAGVAGCQH